MKLQRRTRIVLVCLAVLVAAISVVALVGFQVSTHPAAAASEGRVSRSSELEAEIDAPGPVVVETVVAADWEVDRSGLLDLDNPVAKKANLKDGPEPIQIYFHVVRHPVRGTFIVDTGVERALETDPDHAAIRGPVAQFMHLEKLHVRTDTATWLSREKAPLSGVFLTHLHLDHVSGMPDVPRGTPIFAGPKETTARSALNILVRPITDRELAGQAAISEWSFAPDPDGRFAGVIDVFGDGSFWAIWVPGHTQGSTAYLARTPNGPVLLTGDTCHTVWGWENDVEPGSFTEDREANAKSLHALRELVARHPSIDVRLGHQSLPRVDTTSSTAAR